MDGDEIIKFENLEEWILTSTNLVILSSCQASSLANIGAVSTLDILHVSEKKEFRVNLSIDITKTTISASRIAGDLPFLIAKRSSCVCGSILSLGDHHISLKNEEISFEGTYICPSCSKRKLSLVYTISQLVSEIWKGIKKVQVGPILIENQDSSRNKQD
jgi:hypothetical protein